MVRRRASCIWGRVIGMSRRSRLPENLHALDVTLSADELTALGQAFLPGAIVGSRS
jgi:aryl-alcohol dehydrogenase-like predicted oxidoreductase